MSQWLAQVIERAGNVDDWLASARSKALAELKQKEWPGRRTEAWRYTSLHKVADLNLATTSNATTAEAPQVEGLNSIDLVFVDGRLTSDMTNLVLPDGVTIASLDTKNDAAENLFGQVKPQHHLFGLVNDVLAQPRASSLILRQTQTWSSQYALLTSPAMVWSRTSGHWFVSVKALKPLLLSTA